MECELLPTFKISDLTILPSFFLHLRNSLNKAAEDTYHISYV